MASRSSREECSYSADCRSRFFSLVVLLLGAISVQTARGGATSLVRFGGLSNRLTGLTCNRVGVVFSCAASEGQYLAVFEGEGFGGLSQSCFARVYRARYVFYLYVLRSFFCLEWREGVFVHRLAFPPFLSISRSVQCEGCAPSERFRGTHDQHACSVQVFSCSLGFCMVPWDTFFRPSFNKDYILQRCRGVRLPNEGPVRNSTLQPLSCLCGGCPT